MQVIEMLPSGETREIKLTPEELAKQEKQFLEDFDPVTMEPRSLQQYRARLDRNSPPSRPSPPRARPD